MKIYILMKIFKFIIIITVIIIISWLSFFPSVSILNYINQFQILNLFSINLFSINLNEFINFNIIIKESLSSLSKFLYISINGFILTMNIMIPIIFLFIIVIFIIIIIINIIKYIKIKYEFLKKYIKNIK